MAGAEQTAMMLARGHATAARIAALLGVHVVNVYRQVKNGRFKASRIGRSWYIDLASLRAYLAAPTSGEPFQPMLDAVDDLIREGKMLADARAKLAAGDALEADDE
jgi:excisionase family DNA binding protein